MDNSDDEETSRKCFKYQHKLTGSLKILYNSSNSMLCLWNRYQIFIHEGFNFKEAAKIFPEFQIKQTLILNNYLICLDWVGNVHIISMKFKHSAQKRLKSCFITREHNIINIEQIGEDVILIKYETDKYFLCLHKANSDFQLKRKNEITIKDIPPPTSTRILFYVQALRTLQFNLLKEIFDKKDSNCTNHYILIFTYDKKTIFGCLFNPDCEEDLHLVKLYHCSTYINDIKILNFNNVEIIIGLSSGTLIKLTLDRNRTCKLFHMNTCIEKFFEINNSIIYTDCRTLWIADNVFTDEVIFKQFFVKQVSDFIKCGDQIICTTFTNYIYSFSVDDVTSYIMNSREEYCSAEHLLDNREYLVRILQEVEKMEDLAKKIIEEKNYISTLALSNRKDVMDSLVQYKIMVFDNFEDILTEDKTIFADNTKEIFDDNMFYILINVSIIASMQQNFCEILSNEFGDLRMHVTICTNNKIIKTTSVQILEQLKKINLIVTLQSEHTEKRIFLNIELVTKISGVLDNKENLWICLHRKIIEINSEHFIRLKRTPKLIFLKNKKESFEDLLLKTLDSQHGAVFKFSNKPKSFSNEWTYFIRLPETFREIFKNEDSYREHFYIRKTKYFLEETSNEEFLKARSSFNFDVKNGKLEIEINDDGFSPPILKIFSRNHKIALDFRNFFSNLFNKFIVGSERQMVVKYSLYAAAENFKKELKDCLEKGKDFREFNDIYQLFQRTIIGDLPI